MKTKTKKTFSFLAVLVLGIAIVGLVSPVVADDCQIKINGTITDMDNNPIVGWYVTIERYYSGIWYPMVENTTTNSAGYYETPLCDSSDSDRVSDYRRRIWDSDGEPVNDTTQLIDDWTCAGTSCVHTWDYIQDPGVRFEGCITYPDGSGVLGTKVQIKKKALGFWRSMGTDTTDSSGHYNIPPTGYTIVVYKNDVYRLYVNDNQVDEQTICGNAKYGGDWTCEGWDWYGRNWSHTWDYTIPEFATIAIPAIAVLGLFIFFNKRKQRKD